MRTNTFLFGVMLLVAFTLALITAQVPQAYAATVLFNTDGFSINEYNAATGAFQGNVPLGAVALGARYAFGIGPKGNFYIASDSTAGSTLFTYDAAGNLIGSTAIPLFNVADSSTFPQAITVDATDKLLFVATGSHVVAFSLVDGVPNGVQYTLGGFGQVALAQGVLFNTDGFSINEYNAATGAFLENVPLGAVALGARYAFDIGPKGNFYIASDSTAGSTLFTYDAAGNLIGSTAIPLFNVADSSTFPQAITVDASDKLLFVATGSHVVAFSLVDGVPNGVQYTLGGFGQVALAHGRNLKK